MKHPKNPKQLQYVNHPHIIIYKINKYIGKRKKISGKIE